VKTLSSLRCVTDTPNDLEPPPESALLKDAYRKSGLTVADLAAATGLSTGTLHIAMNGIRYRDGKGRVAVPPDRTLVKLASVLRIHPDALRSHGRGRAADLLAEASNAEDEPTATFSSDLEAQSAVAGRAALARQVLALFSTEELRSELERRDQTEHDELDVEGRDDAAPDL
jgi:transcriptional regulator with XRE-family HTH domain